MEIVVDASDLRVLADAYSSTPEQAFDELEPIVERGALNIKNRARDLVSAAITGTYLPHYPRAIDYEVDSGGGWMEAEIGPNPDMPQGGMGRGVEYGSSHTGPTPHLDPAYEEEVPRFEEQALEALERSLP